MVNVRAISNRNAYDKDYKKSLQSDMKKSPDGTAWRVGRSLYDGWSKGKIAEKWFDFLNLFYPRLCIGCGETLIRTEKDLCLSCLLELPFISNGRAMANFIEERFYGRVEIEEATSFLYYEKETISQSILHEIKYHGNKELGRRLGRMFGAKVLNSRFQTVDALVPVPLHEHKLRLRGYNQSEWIAMGMADVLGKPLWTDVLYRTIENPTQTKKNAIDRWENVKGIFQLTHQREITGKHLLLVDDVLTTGATIEACVLPLKEENVKVSVATLAAVN